VEAALIHAEERTVQTDGRMYMTKLRGAFRDYVKAPKTTKYLNSDLITPLETPTEFNKNYQSVFCHYFV
jgi:hypothetical protein